MKKVLYIFVLTMLSFGLLNAKKSINTTVNTPDLKLEASVKPDNLKFNKTSKKENSLQAERTTLYQVFNQYMGGAKHSPVSYEPKSGFFYFTALDGTDGDPNGDITHLFYLDPNTGNWGHDTTRANFSEFEYYLFPSLAVTNPLNSDDREDHVVYTHLTFYDLDPDNPGFLKQSGARVYISALAYDYGYDYLDMDPFPFIGPKNEADDNNYIWNDVDLIGVDGDDETSFFFASALIPADRNTDRWGAYGINGYDVVFGNQITDKVPENWGYDDFRFDAGNGGSFGNIPSLGSDANGNLYMAVNHLFPSQIEDRTPGVSKSTDRGVTWSDFNIMIDTKLHDYAANQGLDDMNIGSNIAYDIDGFNVFGEDHYSYIFRINLFDAEGNLANVHIVEALYDETKTWNVSFIADLNTSQLSAIRTANTNPAYLGKNFRLGTNARGHELETAVTADGKYQVVKWIDWNLDHLSIMPDGWNDLVQLSGGAYQVVEGYDSLYACDIFMAWKEIGTEGWNGPFNVSNDEVNSEFTFMPDVVPSLTNIPVMMLTTADYEDDDYSGAFRDLPDVFEQYITEKIVKNVEYMELDATQSFEGTPTKTIEHNITDSYIHFSNVSTDSDLTKEIVFTNSGNTTLTITEINVDGDSDGFNFSAASTPLVIEPKSTGTLEATFAPSVVGKEYEATLTLVSDADNNDDISITLFGLGVYKSVYEESNEFLDININPNPISNKGSVDFTIKGTNPQNLKMTLFGSNGQKVIDLFNEVVIAGSSKSIEINADNFTSGSYNLIIEIDGKLLRKSIIINK